MVHHLQFMSASCRWPAKHHIPNRQQGGQLHIMDRGSYGGYRVLQRETAANTPRTTVVFPRRTGPNEALRDFSPVSFRRCPFERSRNAAIDRSLWLMKPARIAQYPCKGLPTNRSEVSAFFRVYCVLHRGCVRLSRPERRGPLSPWSLLSEIDPGDGTRRMRYTRQTGDCRSVGRVFGRRKQ